MDIWKQLITAGFSHVLNVFLSVYVTELTHVGNGCSWYLIQLMMDITVGVLCSYVLFKTVDTIAVKLGIEVLKSGVYTDVNVSLIDDDVNPDDLVDYKIWFIQLIVWATIMSITSVVKFFLQIAFPV